MGVHQMTHTHSGTILSACLYIKISSLRPWQFFTNTVRPYKTEATLRKGPVQSNKALNRVAWHMLTRQFAVCHSAWIELKAKLWTRLGDRHCSDAAQEAFSDSCNTDYIVWRPIKGENDESSHAGHTQCTNGSGQMVEERDFRDAFWETLTLLRSPSATLRYLS